MFLVYCVRIFAHREWVKLTANGFSLKSVARWVRGIAGDECGAPFENKGRFKLSGFRLGKFFDRLLANDRFIVLAIYKEWSERRTVNGKYENRSDCSIWALWVTLPLFSVAFLAAFARLLRAGGEQHHWAYLAADTAKIG